MEEDERTVRVEIRNKAGEVVTATEGRLIEFAWERPPVEGPPIGVTKTFAPGRFTHVRLVLEPAK